MWIQRRVGLKARSRGFHLVTEEICRQLPELARLSVGLAHFFLQHTSASLSLNENADPAVRRDMESYFNRLAPENAPYFEHVEEGPDDMPAHLKSALLGASSPFLCGRGNCSWGMAGYLSGRTQKPGCRADCYCHPARGTGVSGCG